MTDSTKNQAPSLYNETYNAAPLKILKRNKNDFIDRKTVWHIAIFSFLLGTLISLFTFWMISNQSVVSNVESNQSTGHKTTERDQPLAQPQTNSPSQTITDKSMHAQDGNIQSSPAAPKKDYVSQQDTVNSQETHKDVSAFKGIAHTATTATVSNATMSNATIKSKASTKTTAMIEHKINPKADKSSVTKPTLAVKSDAAKSIKTKTSSHSKDAPKVDVIEQWINTNLSQQSGHNPFKVLESDNHAAHPSTNKTNKNNDNNHKNQQNNQQKTKSKHHDNLTISQKQASRQSQNKDK